MAKINTLNYQTVASWNGSQDLFVVEQTDGTKVATPEQIKQYVLGDMDEVPTQNSNNPVKSGGIYSKIGDLTQTGLTGDSVAEQLDTAREQIAQLNDDLVATRTNITPQTGVNTDNNNKCYYEKVAGVVNVVINVKQLTAGTVSRICTLPAGYRPYAKITSAADNAGTGTGRAFVNVDASGNVDAYTSATQYVSGQLTFVAYS